MRKFTAIVAIAFQISPSWSASYYVSPDGNDANSGTDPTAPWQTIAKVNAATFGPGDTVSFKGGASFAGNLVINASGSASAPLVINSYDTGKATVVAGTGYGIVLENSQYVRVSNLIVTGNSVDNDAVYNDGISLWHNDNSAIRLQSVYIDSVEASGFRGVGISFYNDGTSAGWNDLKVTNADCHGNGYAGMWMGGQGTFPFNNVYVGCSKFHDNQGFNDTSEQVGNGLFFKQVDGGTIERCLAYNNGALNRASNGPVGLWAVVSNNIKIQFNESYSNHTRGGDGCGFDLDGGVTNSVIQYNYSHNNDGAGYLIYSFGTGYPNSNNTVRYNVSENDGRTKGHGAIFIGGCSACPISNLNVYNNTVYAGSFGSANSGHFALLRTRSAVFSNVRISNNIFKTDSGVPLVRSVSSPGLAYNGNDYWSRGGSPFKIIYGGTIYTSLSAFRATGKEKLNGLNTGFQVAPNLTSAGNGGTIGDTNRLYTLNAYRLRPGSPMIDVGLNLNTLFGTQPGSQDFYNDTIPQRTTFDIGAHDLPP